MKLDGLAFPSEKVDKYLLDEWEENATKLPTSYNVADSMVTIFSIPSKNDEGEPLDIYAIYIGKIDSIPNDTVIVYCHGQSLHMDAYWPRAKLLANCGKKYKYGVLMMDYQGYGMSEGTTTEQALYNDVEACLSWLKGKGAKPSQTIMYGFSLGTIPAIDRTAYTPSLKPNKLILEAPLASVDNLAQESTILNISGKFVSTLEFNNAEKIKDVKQPFMWMHGTIDDYLSISNGELIYKNYTGSYSEAHRINGANHSDIPDIWGNEKYLEALNNFIVK